LGTLSAKHHCRASRRQRLTSSFAFVPTVSAFISAHNRDNLHLERFLRPTGLEMVLGISLRRKRREDATDDGDSIIASPSLPDIAPTNLQWPSDFIADAAAEDTSLQPSDDAGSPGREPIRHPAASSIPFHKPFRKDSFQSNEHDDTTKDASRDHGRPSIASMYATRPVPSFTRPSKSSTPSSVVSAKLPTRSKRRVPHVIPTFNIMVAGGAKTGKTSISRLLLQTCQISPSATPAQRESLENFMNGTVSPTNSVRSVTLEIDEGPDRIALTLMDTPGLVLSNELDLERSVTSILRLFDTRFAETLEEVRDTCAVSMHDYSLCTSPGK
jgi:hypothetical protein